MPGQLLAKYLQTGPAEDDPESQLEQLVVDFALPIVRRVVGRRLGASNRDRREDVISEALTSLIARLRLLRRDPSAGAPIGDFSSYAAGVASNAVRQHISSIHPERSRLRRRIRLVLTTDNRFSLWESALGYWLCSLDRKRTGGRVPAAKIEECRRDLGATRLPGDLPELLKMILTRLGGPVELNDLVGLCSYLLGFGDEFQEMENIEERVAGPDPALDRNSDVQAWMALFWKEILELPERQRLALLLNLRAPGGAALGLIEDIGVATFADLGAAVGMTPKELSEIWDRLPFSDLEIAERLGVERQQVINLRSAARERLTRRLGLGKGKGTILPEVWKMTN